MADVKISGLPASTVPLAGTEVLPIVQGGVTKKVAVSDLTAGRAVSAASLALTTTPLPVASGGTGLTTLATGYIPYGNGTGAFSSSANLNYTNGGLLLGTTSNPNASGMIINGAFGFYRGLVLQGSGTDGQQILISNTGGSLRVGVEASVGGNTAVGTTAYAGVLNVSGALPMQFATNNNVRATIDSTGNLKVETGNLVIGTSGKGIDFSATPGTGTSELLADYEEGTHTATITPSVSGTVTLNTGGALNLLTYTKIGQQVTVVGDLVVDSVASPVGYFSISLPFNIGTSGAGARRPSGSVTLNTVVSANISDFVVVSVEGASAVRVYLGDATSIQNDSAQQLQTNTEIFVSFTYFV